MYDPDAPPVFPRTTVRILAGVLVAAVLAALGVFGWGVYRRVAVDRDRDELTRLYQKATAGPVSDAEFDELLALTDSRDPAIRVAALRLVAASPGEVGTRRRTLVMGAVVRRLDDPNPAVRRAAIEAMGTIGDPSYIFLVQRFQGSPDQAEREAADRVVQKLQPPPPAVPAPAAPGGPPQ